MKMATIAMLTITATAGLGCSKAVTAADACKKLEAAGVAANCHEEKPEMFAARAKQKYAFDLPSVPGKTGQVLSFADSDAYSATAKAFESAAMLAGPHRYGSEKALIFVQMNTGASLDTGKKAKAVVDAL